MTVQTSYSTEHGEAYPGMTPDMQACNRISKLNGTGALIAFGKGVVSDGENGMQLGGASADPLTFVGVVTRELNRALPDPATTAGVPDGRDGTVTTHGPIWVVAAATVAKDEQAFLRVGATQQGDWSNAAGTGVTESVSIPGAKFLTGGDAGDLVLLSLGVGG